jgi:ketosteroid isomerase-like protein
VVKKLKTKQSDVTKTKDEEIVREIAETWYNAPITRETEKAFNCLADDIEWVNIQPIKGVSDVLPWIGTKQGAKNVAKAFEIYMGLVDVTGFELLGLLVQGDQAFGITKEIGVVKATGHTFEVDFGSWLKIDPSKGKITNWKAFWDPSPAVVAFQK